MPCLQRRPSNVISFNIMLKNNELVKTVANCFSKVTSLALMTRRLTFLRLSVLQRSFRLSVLKRRMTAHCLFDQYDTCQKKDEYNSELHSAVNNTAAQYEYC